ncbi:MAG TPA: hypothetical protein VLJ88_05330 [Propionibacteriaceae bacterium]|nr:hypothetical protein [Propionibacteriaceae bacterium]
MARIKRVLGDARQQAYDAALLRRRRQKFAQQFAAAPPGDVRVQIGSGRRILPGWINTDVSWYSPAHLDLLQPWPVPPGSVQFVFGDNVIEHLRLDEARIALRHVHRAMAPGGVLRLATPDVEASARSYLENGELARQGILRSAELGRAIDHPVQLLAQVYVGSGHYLGFCYDYPALAAELAAVGFVVHRCATGESEYAELRGLETRTHPAESATQLCVEAVKTA